MSLMNVLVVDDDPSMRTMLKMVLGKNGYTVYEAPNGRSGVELFGQLENPVTLCDVRMPDMDGLEFLEKIMEQFPGHATSIVMMSAYGSVDTVVSCMKKGAFHYINKPFKPEELLVLVGRAFDTRSLKEENIELKKQLKVRGKKGIIYGCGRMQDIVDHVSRIAPLTSPVLIHGETGTGKELIAKEIHVQSRRSGAPFFAINCSALPPTLVESELFGHAKGAFTGASGKRKGYFEEADGGTLFLDEIADLPLELQPKLLRVLQEGEITRVGESQAIKVDVRLVAASARPLEDLVRDGLFRDDLYYRLNVLDVTLPPLREREDDVVLLARHFVEAISAREGRTAPELTEGALDRLKSYPWPGNVRELENVLERSLVFLRGNVVEAEAISLPNEHVRAAPVEGLSLKKAVEQLEREYIERALDETGGNRTRAAKLLEISLRGLMYKIKEYGIDG